MNDRALNALSDLITQAHASIQAQYEQLNPVVGVNRGMRQSGIPADAFTIDCLKTGKRIILILHDLQPNIVSYQFSYKDKDPSDTFYKLGLDELTADTLFGWMTEYFLTAT